MKAIKVMATTDEQGQLTLDSPLMIDKNRRVEVIVLVAEDKELAMQGVSSYTQELYNTISPIVEKLFKGSSLYTVKLNKQEMIDMLVELFGKFTPEEMRAIKENDLIKRINSILVLNAVSGTLNDLTPEQIKMFDEAVEGR